MNILSNFIPNKYVTFNDKDLPWITNHLKQNLLQKESISSIQNMEEDL